MRVSKLILVAIAIVAVACSPSEQSSEIKDVAKIGALISKETAMAMLGMNNTAGRQIQPEAFIYGKTMLQQILSTPGAEGILIYNGQDKARAMKLVFRPAGASGDAVAGSYTYDEGMVCPPVCPKENISSIGKVVNPAEAKTWIANFQSANKDRARSFLFGKDIFNQLLAQPGVAGIAFMKGSKASGEDAMVLIGVTQDGTLLWDSGGDAGLPCPPYCSASASN